MADSARKSKMKMPESSTGTTILKSSVKVHPSVMSGLKLHSQDLAKLVERPQLMKTKSDPDTADAIIIGGGPGGYVAAIRAAQLGGKVILVEKDELGGVCLNRGCIPTKVMLSTADVYDTVARRCGEFGVSTGEVSLDYAKAIERRDRVVKQLVSGVGFLMKKHSIQVLKGIGKLISRTEVEVTLADGKKQTVSGRNIIIATGSEAVELPIPGLEGENVWDSDGALNATQVPKTLLVIGGGAIGVEWGYMFAKLGAQVTIVELMSQLLPLTDSEVAAELKKCLEKDGIKILTESRVTKVEHKKGSEIATVLTGTTLRSSSLRSTSESEQKIEAEKILVAVGRRPISEGIGVEELGIATDRGRIVVNERMQTNVPGVYAIGDVVGGLLLAHKASEEGVVAAENIMGRDSKMSYKSIPSAVYTTPEVATVGLTEEAAKDKGIECKVGRFYFRANGKALGLGERDGFVKFVADAKYGEIVGCHMIGPHVTDLIHEVVVGMDSEATIELLGRAVHAHPTLSEVVKEAALDADGASIHMG